MASAFAESRPLTLPRLNDGIFFFGVYAINEKSQHSPAY